MHIPLQTPFKVFIFVVVVVFFKMFRTLSFDSFSAIYISFPFLSILTLRHPDRLIGVECRTIGIYFAEFLKLIHPITISHLKKLRMVYLC